MKSLAVAFLLLVPSVAYADGLTITGSSLNLQGSEYVFAMETASPLNLSAMDDAGRLREQMQYLIADGQLNPWQGIYLAERIDLTIWKPGVFTATTSGGVDLGDFPYTVSGRIVTVRVPQAVIASNDFTFLARTFRFGATIDERPACWSQPQAHATATREMTFGKVKALYR